MESVLFFLFLHYVDVIQSLFLAFSVLYLFFVTPLISPSPPKPILSIFPKWFAYLLAIYTLLVLLTPPVLIAWNLSLFRAIHWIILPYVAVHLTAWIMYVLLMARRWLRPSLWGLLGTLVIETVMVIAFVHNGAGGWHHLLTVQNLKSSLSLSDTSIRLIYMQIAVYVQLPTAFMALVISVLWVLVKLRLIRFDDRIGLAVQVTPTTGYTPIDVDDNNQSSLASGLVIGPHVANASDTVIYSLSNINLNASSSSSTVDDSSYAKSFVVPPSVFEASAYNLLLFRWLNQLIVLGNQRPLQEDDIPLLHSSDSVHDTGRFLDKAWRSELARRDLVISGTLVDASQSTAPHSHKTIYDDAIADLDHDNGEKVTRLELEAWEAKARGSLLVALLRSFGLQLFVAGVFKFMNDICNFLGPFFVREILLFSQNHPKEAGAEGNQASISYGIFLAICLALTYAVQTAVFNQFFSMVTEVSLRVRGALIWMIFHKSMRLSTEGRNLYPSATVQNMISKDASAIGDLAQQFNLLWSSLFQVMFAFYSLTLLLGLWPTVVGVTVIIVSVPLSGIIMKKSRRARDNTLVYADERLKILSEVVLGIRSVKCYAWENFFIARILKAREKELEEIKKQLMYFAFLSTITGSAPILLAVFSFTAYVLLGHKLEAYVIFPAMGLFNVIRPPLIIMPRVLVSFLQALSSMERIRKFLLVEEIEDMQSEASKAMRTELFAHASDPQNVDIIAKNAWFSWTKNLDLLDCAVQDFSLEAKNGSLTCIVGQTASGKSTVLAGVLSEAYTVKGAVGIKDGKKIAFVDQSAFIMNGTLKENILFGAPFDPEKYKQAIYASALESDIKMLPAGDQTELGGRGINLSGGQKQRVSIARAVYADADIYLFDDPLSAVDAAVGKHIFYNCIVGVLKDKTRVLVTNQFHFAAADKTCHIICLKDGNVIEQGTPDQLISSGQSFGTLLKEQGIELDTLKDIQTENVNDKSQHQEVPPREDKAPNTSVKSDEASSKGVSAKEDEKDSLLEKGKLTQTETRSTGHVDVSNYITYVKAIGGIPFVVLIFGFAILSQFLSIAVTYWMSIWSDEGIQPDPGTTFYLLVYAALGIFAVVVTAVSAIVLANGAYKASVVMHEKLLRTVFNAPISWFDASPVGRVLNRFSGDLDKLDNSVASVTNMFLKNILTLIGSVCTIIFVAPMFTFPMVIVAIVFLFIQDFYRKSMLDLRRLEAISRSPLQSHVVESIDGLFTLRAYQGVEKMESQGEKLIDQYNRISFSAMSSNRWLSVRLDLLSSLLIFSTAFIVVLDNGSTGLAGMALTYALQLTGVMTWTVRQSAEVESQMNAIERICEYSTVPPFPQEEAEKQLSTGPLQSWPSHGQIQFKDVWMSYRSGLPPVLRGLTFSTQTSEKIGIVGRTGAGKSSLLSALFRLTPLEKGFITIDGVDIKDVNLPLLRSKLSIIPQDPVLFGGTIRTNLDPFNEYSDTQIWSTLRTCGLASAVTSLGGLDAKISPGGTTMSLGQKQLLCLGRSLLRSSKILILDEATASVDPETDATVQDTLSKSFSGCTILTVAHRINTIIGSDRIIFLDKGEIVECGTPGALLSNKNSKFSGLVDETGAATANKMRALARGDRVELTAADENSCTRVCGGLDRPLWRHRSFDLRKCPLSREEEPLDQRASTATPKSKLLQRTRRARLRRAYMQIREAIINVDDEDWIREIEEMGTSQSQWKKCLTKMVQSLYDLSTAHLSAEASQGSTDMVNNMPMMEAMVGRPPSVFVEAESFARGNRAQIEDKSSLRKLYSMPPLGATYGAVETS